MVGGRMQAVPALMLCGDSSTACDSKMNALVQERKITCLTAWMAFQSQELPRWPDGRARAAALQTSAAPPPAWAKHKETNNSMSDKGSQVVASMDALVKSGA